ncbi:MAG: alpha/beta hydrolase [Bacteroidota bacterium]
MAKAKNNELLNMKILGEGYPVVFLHGFLESNSMWNYLPLMEFGIQCVLIELPGHGASSNSNGNPSINNMLKRVVSTLEQLEIERCSVIGHSMGGYVALEMKSQLAFVEKVILLNSNYWSDTKQKALDRLRIASFIHEGKSLFLKEAVPNLFLDKKLHKSNIDQLLAEALTMSPEAIAYSSIAMSKRKRHLKLLLEHPHDFFIIQGDKDPVAPKALWNPLITGNNPNYFEIENCGHMAHIEKTKEVKKILKSVFNTI